MNPAHHPRLPASGANQRGAATLLVTVILLFAATLLTFSVSKTSITEQKISANEVRQRQALNAAQAGAEFAAAYFRGDYSPDANNDGTPDLPVLRGIDRDGNAAVDTNFFTTTDANLSGRVSVAFCAPNPGTDFSCGDTAGTINNCTAPAAANWTSPQVVSCGWSDDNAARRLVTYQLQAPPAFPNSPGSAMTLKGGLSASGSFTVVNYFNNFSYWLGDDLEFGNATGKSFIRTPGHTPTAYAGDKREKSRQLADALGCSPLETSGGQYYYANNCNAPANSSTASLVLTTDKSNSSNVMGIDVVDKDYNLATLTDDAFFANFFGTTPAEYRNIATRDVTAAEVAAGAINNALSEIIWVEGDIDIPGQLGSIDNPVILVVNGDANLGANARIYGILYVSGDISGNGNGEIFGAAIIAGDSNGLTGNAEVIYDEQVLENISITPMGGTPVPGTWRDWTR